MKKLLSLSILIFLSIVFSHASVVLVDLTLIPQTPKANQNFKLQLHLKDPLQTPIEDAVILVEATLEGGENSQPITTNLKETLVGTYQGSLNLPQDGAWELFFRDQTFKREEATARVSINIGTENPEIIQFVFPPTNTLDSNNLLVWLIWVIGLPIVAAIIVTILVLSNSKVEKPKSSRRN